MVLPKPVRIILIILLSCLSVYSIYRGITVAYITECVDSQYPAFKFLFQAVNPYELYLKDTSLFPHSQVPNYFPQFYLVFFPFGFLSVKVFYIVWPIFNVILSLMLFFIAYRKKLLSLP